MVHTMDSRLKGICLLVITAVLWSSGGVLIKWIDWHPLAIAGVRSAISAIVIRIIFRKYRVQWTLPQCIGAVAYCATMLSFVAATKLTTAANAIVLQYTAPIYVAALGAVFLHEKPGKGDWLTIGCVLAGMVLFFQDKMSAGGLLGNILAIASGVFMAVSIVALRWQRDGAAFGSVLLGNVLTFLCGLPFALDTSPGFTGWSILVYLGCFQLGISWAIYTLAIKRVEALEASLITIIEPILNPVWVFLLLGEVPGPWALVGGCVILTAITARYVLPALKSPMQSSAENSP